MLKRPPQGEHRVVLHDVSWGTYQRLLAEQGNRGNPRFTYDRGMLEIISPSGEHEELKHTLALIVDALAEGLNIDTRGLGSTTFRRASLARGFAPDACFYIANVAHVKGKTNIDLAVDPPPDLVVEIDITCGSLDRLALFAAVGVVEVWRHDGKELAFYVRLEDGYVEREQSSVLPGVHRAAVAQFIKDSVTADRPTWLREMRQRVQAERGS
ncbi:MAG: Uma2 family endonuclease [Nitrococcus sp.]|nr:Uma2 family endonuclease [Nitrococcus sp.]